MVPDRYTLEKLALEHRQQLYREAEHEQKLGELPEHSPRLMRQTLGTLGTFLIVFGMKLKKLEQGRKQIAIESIGRFQYEKSLSPIVYHVEEC